ncbi:MAG: NAD+ synthase [Gammaproteobacteria bacterium]|nr:NAD+ synthase [Gammaproteobacteria bacterium]
MKKLRIVIAQLNLIMGDIEGNLKKHIEAATTARDELKADIILFPELSLTGYPVDDLLNRKSFLQESDSALQKFTQEIDGIYCLVGHPQTYNDDLYNACSFIYNKKIIATYFKQQLPNYGVFDERRYFTPGSSNTIVNVNDIPIGIVICEDLWFPDAVKRAAAEGAKIILSPNASPFEIDKHERRAEILSKRARDSHIPIFYVNYVSSQDEIIFDGGSMVVNAAGKICQHAGFFKENLLSVDTIFNDTSIDIETKDFILPTTEEKIYNCLVFGVRNYLQKNKFTKALLGLSGGIDSALTLAIAVDAIGKENVTAIIMPSRYTSEMSMQDAVAIANNFGVKYEIISIEPTFTSFLESLKSVFKNTKSNIAEENLQARCRGMILMAISNKFGGIVLTTSNRSETAVGYTTLYGDMAGGLAVLKDVPKTLVYQLSNYRNTLSADIPQRIIDRAPSAELAFNQKDEDSLPPYSVLDKILELYIDQEQGLEKIVAQGFDREVVARIIKLINRNEYKRRQSAVGIRISHKDFGRDRRYPITTMFDK